MDALLASETQTKKNGDLRESLCYYLSIVFVLLAFIFSSVSLGLCSAVCYFVLVLISRVLFKIRSILTSSLTLISSSLSLLVLLFILIVLVMLSLVLVLLFTSILLNNLLKMLWRMSS